MPTDEDPTPRTGAIWAWSWFGADEARPHGSRYELILHDRANRRVFGYDNAHAVELPGERFVEQPRINDHVHRGPKDSGQPYAF